MMHLRSMGFLPVLRLGFQIIPVVQHFEHQGRGDILQLHLVAGTDHLYVLQGLLMLLLVFLAGDFRHLVVFGNADVEAIYHRLIVGSLVLAVHLPEGVGSQSQHQSRQLTVVLLIHPLASVEGKTSEFDSRDFYLLRSHLGREILTCLRLQVVPSCHRRNASHSGEFHDGVGSASGVASYHDDLTLSGSDVESIFGCDELMERSAELFYGRKLLVGELVELVNLDVGTGFLLRLVAGYSLHVVGKHPEGNLHHRCSGGVDRVAYLARSIRPVDAGSCSHILFLLTFAEGFSACLLYGKTSQRKGETYYDFLIIHFYSVLSF